MSLKRVIDRVMIMISGSTVEDSRKKEIIKSSMGMGRDDENLEQRREAVEAIVEGYLENTLPAPNTDPLFEYYREVLKPTGRPLKKVRLIPTDNPILKTPQPRKLSPKTLYEH